MPTPEDLKVALANGGVSKREKGHVAISVGEAIRTQIADLRKITTPALRREGKDPSRYQAIIDESEFADRAFCAARIFKNLDDIVRISTVAGPQPDIS